VLRVVAPGPRDQADVLAVLLEDAVVVQSRDGQQRVADRQPVRAALVHQTAHLAHVLIREVDTFPIKIN
jgi:hypothetical protein